MILASAAAYRRKKRDFVPGIEQGAPGGEFLVPGRDQRTTITREVGAAGNKLCEELFDAGTGCEIHKFLGTPGNFFEPAEEEDFYADRRF